MKELKTIRGMPDLFGSQIQGISFVEKTFNKMLELGRSIADAWDMKLCDESFNTISEQRISEYKNEAHEVDLKNGSYGG